MSEKTKVKSEESKQEIKENIHCPECNSDKLVEDGKRGEVICQDCGLVVERDKIDKGPEWRSFSHEEEQQKSRVGAPTTKRMHDKGLTTKIDWKNKDFSGKSLTPEKKRRMNRLRKWNKRVKTKDPQERNLQFALSEIDRMSSALGLPKSIREVASVIYRQALDKDLIRGRSIEGVATASLYAACRQENIPRSLEEITDVARVDKKEIGRTYRYVSSEIGLELEPVDPKSFVRRFCSELGLEEEVIQIANKMIDEGAKNGLLSGKSPTGFAAAAIYAASLLANDKRTQKEVSEVANVTEVTIRNRYQELVDNLSEEDY